MATLKWTVQEWNRIGAYKIWHEQIYKLYGVYLIKIDLKH